jgi:ADP-ribosylglycohydrolase
MLGAIAGDIIGSVYEFDNVKTKDFSPLFHPRAVFTDDTVLTVALADSILSGRPYRDCLVAYYRRYPDAGYGERFRRWAERGPQAPYGSWGNGSAMRVSPVAYAYDELDAVLRAAADSAAVTHDHPEGVKGAQAIAAAVFLARRGEGKDAIARYIERTFGYDLSVPLDRIRPGYLFDVSCQGSVPPAVRAFLESSDWEDAVRNAVSLGGDSDTLACMAGAIAQAHYGLPQAVEHEVRARLDPALLDVIDRFRGRFPGA